MSTGQRYRLRNPSTGREVVIEIDEQLEREDIFRDRESGERLEVVGKVLPMVPSRSKLPWSVENLRFCPWCREMSQRDLNDCPVCGRRMGPLEQPSGTA